MMTVKKVRALRKLKADIDSGVETGRIGQVRVTPLIRDSLLIAYDELRGNGRTEFIISEIKDILAKYGIPVKVKGIGFEAQL